MSTSDGLRQRKVSTEKTDIEKTAALDVATKYYEKAAPVIQKVTITYIFITIIITNIIRLLPFCKLLEYH